MARREIDDDELLVGSVLDQLAGGALVLDADLEVRYASGMAEELLGVDIRRGLSAPALLCGDRPKRPIAEALASGRAAQALVPHPGQAARLVHVRSLPVGGGARPTGWLVLLDDAGDEHGDDKELFHGMWARDQRMKRMFRLLERVAAEEVPVLVRGETGAGKELVARALHALSPTRQRGPFRALNCAALPPTLLESELFGHVRGAFTGAVKNQPGHIQLAAGGTLFLDEVAELPLELQAKLLRVLEDHVITPVGGREPLPVDVRIVSATHRSLREAVEAGRFRADLMYRLRVIPVFLPPLRERPRDIRLLVEELLPVVAMRRQIERVSPAAMRALELYDWPGNVRELRNVLAYAVVVGDGPVLEHHHLPPEVVESGLGQLVDLATPPPDDEQSLEARRVQDALARAQGSRERAAKLLGMSRVTLWRRMRELGIEAGRGRR